MQSFVRCAVRGDDGGGSLINLDGVVPSQIVGVSASVIFACSVKSRRRFLLLAPARPGSPRKRVVKQLCVCVCVIRCAVSASVLL